MKPKLFVFVGPNGSSKSYFSDQLLKLFNEQIKSFDFDIEFDIIWSKSDYNSYSYDFAFERTGNLFNEQIDSSIANSANFAYQTNFHLNQSDLLNRFINKGYETNLIYFYVNKLSILNERIDYRYKYKNLHPVPSDEVKLRYEQGIKNINTFESKFNKIIIYDNSDSILDSSITKYVPKGIALKDFNTLFINKSCPKEVLNFFPFLKDPKIKKDKGMSF